MKGKDLKAWALRVHDEAIVEIDWGTEFRSDWKPLNESEIQAALSPAMFKVQEVKP